MNVIEINGLVKKYSGFTLGPLNLEVPQGAIVGFVGENGAGKSTTLRLILGLAHPDAGTINLLGQSAGADHPQAHERVGVVFDEISLPDSFTVKNAGEFGKRLYKSWDAQTYASYQQRFRLASSKRVGELSRGMRMKLGLAMALSHAADLLIFDEATSGLDPVIRDEVLDIMLEFIEDPTHSILFSSHIVSDIEKAADYVAFIREGKLKFMEQKDELLDSWRIVALTNEQANQLDSTQVLGRRRHDFGQEVILRTGAVPAGVQAGRPTIEDIMVYTIKGEDQ
ncbi:ABC transporter ATP-binding protein [Actinotignum urinale]|uniref:ABC transporter ATP-binding protein n=1 Tax=Actinotignum urinale TaxID=190146 RepID=UPI000C8071F2|nr:ABC transporter ATP-binding protein [Actinotignum urinale]WIK59674.1 ABC transporter ATP-binding protein [Actinotignum urinale]